MRICYIANSDISHTAKWVKHFVDSGHEVHVISHTRAEIPGAHNYYLNYNIRNFPIMAHRVHNLIRKINPDVLHAHQANTCGLYGVTMRSYRTIVSAWGSDILVAPQKSRLMRFVVKYVLKRAAILTSDAYYMTDRMAELGAKKENIYTFPMGVEESIFQYKHEYDMNSENLKIISIRKLEKIYNIDIIIRGFHDALKTCPNMELTIAASGSEEHNLRNIVQELGIEDKVSFTGRYNPKDVGKMLQEQDVFISVPDSDSTSVSLLEAMAVGVYPVVSDLPGNKEWVTDGENGTVLHQINFQLISRAIIQCTKNKITMSQAQPKNITKIKTQATWQTNARVVEEIYNKLVKTR